MYNISGDPENRGEPMAWKDKLGLAKDKARSLKEAALNQAGDLMDQHWPLVRALWQEKVDAALRETLMDDEKLATYLRIVHEALPLPIRLAVKEDTFIRVCMKNRDRWLTQESPPADETDSPAGKNDEDVRRLVHRDDE